MEESRVAELERRIREATERAEEEQQRAEEELQRAEERRQRAVRLTRPTTLEEYITACHTLVFSRLSVQTDPSLTSKGPITNPRDKWCPNKIQPWSDFVENQRTVIGTLISTFPAARRVFENEAFLEGLGNRISRRKVANEKTLEYFLDNSVEYPVRNIVEQLNKHPETSDVFNMGNGVIFKNHPHAISELAEEVVEREAPPSPPAPPQTPQRQAPGQLRADQICIYRSDETQSSSRTMLYICEYKPPHKLTAPHLRLGLRPMDIYKEVVNRKTIPTSADPAGKFQYYAERLTASAITQTYNYMIEGGLEYSLLTTGETVVFLMIDWKDPGTLYYHLAEPGPEAAAARPNQLHLCTAVGQYLAFTLLVLQARHDHGQEERQRATRDLRTWAEDFETTVRSIPIDERTAASDASYIPGPKTRQDVDRSPIFTRQRRRLFTQDGCGSSSTGPDNHSESSDDESSSKPPDTPTPSTANAGPRRSQRIIPSRPRGGGSRSGGKGPVDAQPETRTGTGTDPQQLRPYCTQKCLLGMVKGQKLDPRCPNVGDHRKLEDDSHPVDHTEWLGMLYQQLKHSLDDGITPLGRGGARGVLFKVTLLAYGYTFVSKGTVKAFIPDLKHEAAVYKRLFSAQGKHVPVFLGAIDLREMHKIYYYDHRVYVIHLSFMSWGGCSISEAEAAGFPREKLREMALRSLQALHRQRIRHQDVRSPNMLFNEETGVMMIDFERAEMVPLQGQALAPIVPNKRAATGEDRHRKEVRRIAMGRHGFRREVMELELLFD